jgi:hypothetical protein
MPRAEVSGDHDRRPAIKALHGPHGGVAIGEQMNQVGFRLHLGKTWTVCVPRGCLKIPVNDPNHVFERHTYAISMSIDIEVCVPYLLASC